MLADSVTFTFGDNEVLCNELLGLIRTGKKTATCVALRDFGPEGDAMPVVGRQDIALNWDGAPALLLETIDVTGRDVANTKKYRDVAETGRAAIVIDGITPGETWAPWAIEIRGHATPIPGPPALIRITPDRVVSWNLDSR